jgi:glutaminyl-tRNA synthetase
VDIAMLEYCIREDLKMKVPRVMGVINPLKVVITNYPEDRIENLNAENNPENPEMGNRQIKFTREIYIEREDFYGRSAKEVLPTCPRP